MAFVKAGDLNLEYYSEGSGPPLLMIRGFAASAAAWGDEFLKLMRQHFTCIRFSNRGTGQSEASAEATTVQMMADDAANLLAALGIERPHVFGVSMGGMIAQEFALAYPERVNGLVLGCTTPGGPKAPAAAANVVSLLAPAPGSTREDQIRATWPALVTPDFIESDRPFLERMLAQATEHPTAVETIVKQLKAVGAFDAYERVPGITAPTLVVHGDADILIPPDNGRLLHERIPGSEMATIAGVGHMFWWQKPDESANAITGFLAQVPAAA